MDIVNYFNYYLDFKNKKYNNQYHWIPIQISTDYNDIPTNNTEAILKKRTSPYYALIDSGYWNVNNKFVIGFRLRSQTNIIRPVFQHMRNFILKDVLNTIKNYIGNGIGSECGYGGGKFLISLRRNMAKSNLLGLCFGDNKKLPPDIICKIGTYI